MVIDRFRRIGCEVWSVKDGPAGRLLALDTQMDKFVRFLEGWQAETESRNTSIRVSEAMRHLARQGKWSGGPPPYGFKLNPVRRPKSDLPALVVDQGQAAVVTLMVDLYLERRMGCLLIAGELNRRGVPTPSGRPWDDQKVRRILQNPIIAGLPAYGRNKQSGSGFTRKNPYDLDQFILPRDEAGNLRPVTEYQLVPLDRWLRLMDAMKAAGAGAGVQPHTVSARVRGSDGLLTGLVCCGHCGARLSANAGRGRLYYECQMQVHRGRPFCDGQRTYGAGRLEQAVIGQLQQHLAGLDAGELAALLRRDSGQSSEGGEARGRRLEAECRKADRVLQGWLARMDAFLGDPEGSPFTEELLAGKIREARERLDSARRRLADARDRSLAAPAGTAAHTDWWACFAAAPVGEKKVLLRSLIERVSVRRDEVTVIFRVGPGTAAGCDRQTERLSYPVPLL